MPKKGKAFLRGIETMFLDKEQLKELTGYARPTSQMNWLARNDYPFEVAADGYPRVLVTLVEKRLGSFIQRPKRNNTPRFAHIGR